MFVFIFAPDGAIVSKMVLHIFVWLEAKLTNVKIYITHLYFKAKTDTIHLNPYKPYGNVEIPRHRMIIVLYTIFMFFFHGIAGCYCACSENIVTMGTKSKKH